MAAALATVGIVLGCSWWLAGRAPGGRAGFGSAEGLAPARTPDGAGSERGRGAWADAPEPQRAAVEPSEAREATPAALATLNGRLQVDGFAPFLGHVWIREVSSERARSAPIDRFGRFFVADVPAAELSLSFEMEWVAERRLLLPSVVVTPVVGGIEVVDLDWTTRHVNVQVLDQGEPAGWTKVELAGPGYAASFETDERGKAKLSLVGRGTFSFRARLPAGRSAETALELDASDELETVLLAAVPGR